jgi:dynein heavy chain
MDHKGWYDRIDKERSFRKIEDIIFVSAMGPPGGGRSVVTQRLQRHFNIITYTNLGSESVEMIFTKVVNKFLGSFADDVKNSISKLVDATQFVYNGVEEKLKPIPAKSHYTFNLRDMSKIF